MSAKKVPVKGHVRSGDVAVRSHDRTVAGSPGDSVSDDQAALVGGLQALATPTDGAAAVPDGWKSVAGVNFRVNDFATVGMSYPTGDGSEQPTVSFAGQDLSGVDFSGVDLSGVDFTGCNLTGANFEETTLSWAVFTGANLSSASFGRCYGEKVTFDGSLMSGVDFYSSELRGVSMVGVDLGEKSLNLEHTTLEMETMTAVPGLEKSYFEWVVLGGVDWSGVKFAADDLAGLVGLSNSSLDDANIDGQKLSNVDLSDVSMKGVSAVGTDFSFGRIGNINASGSNFEGASFRECLIFDSAFDSSNLSLSDWEDVNVTDTGFTDTDFRGARLSGGEFQGSFFQGADFTNASVTRTNFASLWASLDTGDPADTAKVLGCDLSGVKWDGVNTSKAIFASWYPEGVSENGNSHCQSIYDRLSPEQAAKAMGVGMGEFGVLLWSGAVSARDDATTEFVRGRFDINALHVAKWELEY